MDEDYANFFKFASQGDSLQSYQDWTPAPHPPGEKRCVACGGTHRVYMSFFRRFGWYCQFLEADLQSSLPKKLSFKDEAKIIELADRGGAFSNLESRQAIDHAIAIGRGGIWLELAEEQY